jgi:Ca2+-binding EF-hand superfamily protein
VTSHLFKEIDVDRTGLINESELASYLSNLARLAPSKDEIKWRVLQKASRDPKVWTMLSLCVACFFLFGDLCLWGIPPLHHPESR